MAQSKSSLKSAPTGLKQSAARARGMKAGLMPHFGDREMDALAKKLYGEKEAVLTWDSVLNVEHNLQEEGVIRRCALCFLTRPWHELTSKMIEDEEAFEIFENLDHDASDIIAFHRKLADLLESAGARLLMALATAENVRSKRKPEPITTAQ
jgi:hypothetical protein